MDANLRGTARFLAKQDGVLAGMRVWPSRRSQVDSSVALTTLLFADGEAILAGATFSPKCPGRCGPSSRAERVALNFLQRLSGTATLTRAFVDAVRGTRAVILDTRKTTPGLRDLEKYAVRCGGGTNHRRDLAVMAMIKDNHREALAREGRSLADGVAAIRRRTPGIPVEVEIDSLDQLEAALDASPGVDPARQHECRGHGGGGAASGRACKLEASGGVNLKRCGQSRRRASTPSPWAR